MSKKTDGLALQKMFVEHCIDNLPEDSKKKIFYVMKGDGLWQIRKNQLGTFFVHQAEAEIPGLSSDFEEGWELNVPLIPAPLLETTLSFFRAIYKKHRSEVHVQFYYDTEKEEYLLHCPKQKVTGGSTSYEHDKKFDTPEKVLVLEMHSHASMSAFFSGVDDSDEKDDRFFGVIGKVDRYYPEVKMRVSVGGHMMDVDLGDIFDISTDDQGKFPKEWLNKVKKQKLKVIKRKSQPLFGPSNRHMLGGLGHAEMQKYLSGDFLYPSEAYVPDEGAFYLEEDGKKWLVQDGEKVCWVDENDNHHMIEDDEDDEDERVDDIVDMFRRNHGRFV